MAIGFAIAEIPQLIFHILYILYCIRYIVYCYYYFVYSEEEARHLLSLTETLGTKLQF